MKNKLLPADDAPSLNGLTPYQESLRYMDNARAHFKQAGKTNGHYKDPKYVKTASGVAYLGVLLAMDEWLRQRNVAKPKTNANESYYRTQLGRLDKKALASYNDVYEIFHLGGYYRDLNNVAVFDTAFSEAMKLIDRIR